LLTRPFAGVFRGWTLGRASASLRIMRFLAALALLLQVQPLVASALCLYDARMARMECTMPHGDGPAGGTFRASDPGMPGGCAAMAYCAAAPTAWPRFAERPQVIPIVHASPVLSDAPLAPGTGPAPPFHPPRV
jgi:hypothetical protein